MQNEELITKILNMTLKNCYDDSVYNDNTLHDLIYFGFKGLANMTEDELQQELSMLKDWSVEEEENVE